MSRKGLLGVFGVQPALCDFHLPITDPPGRGGGALHDIFLQKEDAMQAASDSGQDGTGIPSGESHADKSQVDYEDEEELEAEHHEL